MPTARAHTLDIRLPEGVVFSLPLAGPTTRFLAWLVDLLGILAMFIVIQQIIGVLSIVSSDAAGGVFIVLTFAVPIFYGVLFEGFWRGQTPGKRVLGLRVMDARGLRLDLRQVVIRNLLRAVDSLPALYLVGGAACFFTTRAQRLGDLAADTVVVRTERPAAPDLAQIAAGKYNTLRDHPVLAARLRQRVPPAEAGIALQSLLRRNALDPDARLEIFARLAGRFRAAGPLPEELTLDLTDEQIVRNVVDVLFQTGGKAALAKS